MKITESKVFHLLRCLTGYEMRKLSSFIDTSLAGPPGMAGELLSFLLPYHPDFLEEQVTKETIWLALFGSGNPQEQKLRYAFSDLYRHTSMYLSTAAMAVKEDESRCLLREALARRGADKAYTFLNEPVLNDTDTGNAEYHMNRFRELNIHLIHFLSRRSRTEPSVLTAAARELDIFYISTKLQMLCELISASNVRSGEHAFFLQDELETVLKNGAFAGIPVIDIYFRILLSLTEPENQLHFLELKEILSNSEDKISHDELRGMYKYLMNYCIKRINQGDSVYVGNLFDIYKTVIQSKIIYSGRYLSQWDFKNIVVIGLRSGNTEWVKQFIEEKSKDLAEKEQQNAYTYNMAYFHFSTGDYHKAMKLLQQVEFTDLYYQLDMRSVLLKCFYETGDEDALGYHLSAFRIFLLRNKEVSEYQRIIYKNLIKFTGMLSRFTGNRKKLEELKQQIEDKKQVADINWIRKKVSEAIDLT